MMLRAAIFFIILINLQFSSAFVNESFSDVTQPLSTDDHKILQDCHNEDYRTYLRCLKRHKRHHEIPGSSQSCLDECMMDSCTSSKCVHDCYTRCKKKITETYSKVTETEYDCAGGNCKDHSHSIVPNITTNVNIKIGVNTTGCNNTTCTTPNRPVFEPSRSRSESQESNNSSKITINNIITNLHGSESSNCLCPGCNCFPWPPMPQITIGFGPGPNSGFGVGCCFPQPCTCYQQSQQNSNCGNCGNPFLRYKCDAPCYNSNLSGRHDNLPLNKTVGHPREIFGYRERT